MKSFSSEESSSIAISTLLLIGGYIWAVYSCPATFARFGALLVCVGIILAYLDLRGIWEESKMLSELDKRQTIKHLSEITEPSKSQEHAERFMYHSEIVSEIFDNNIQSANSRKKQAMLIEVAIIIVGTIVWAFGDLLVYDFGHFTLSSFVCT